MIPVILSGGVGSRLWPLSRGMYPKQLLNLVDSEQSMLQQTLTRLNGLSKVAAPVIVCNEEHRFMVGEQLLQLSIKEATILLEPDGRNTAPAIALAAFHADPDEVLVVMPADHVISDIVSFQTAIEVANKLALQGDLVTFGIVPTSPETGYGYIKAGAGVEGGYGVAEFKEKPAADTAKKYLDDGGYFWNGGIFVFTASAYLAELKKFAPEVFKACERSMRLAKTDLDFLRVDEAAFATSPAISVDYAVMENTSKAKMVPLNAGWNDVGSWSALWDVSGKDSSDNAITGDVLLENTKGSYIYSENKLVAAIGVENLVIVETDDAIMVSSREHAQDVKKVVEQLKHQQRSQVSHHRKVYRPWGWYDSVDVGERFQVKRIQVKPGARLSVQMHNHRAEHWVVVKGTAVVLNGDDTITLNENESTFIPIGSVHSLHNPSEEHALEIIEVQSGSYLGEDDIVRFEDNYGRS